MTKLYPLTFHPIFKERLWGGRTLERLYQKTLPPQLPMGESWEISDRPGDVSVVDQGPLAGQTLEALLRDHRQELLGSVAPVGGRFPLLIKILDAREKLSLQVHPPQSVAHRLRGDPKTEMWYLADADPGAELYVGLRRGVTRQEFEEKLRTAAVAECFHRVPVRAGDAMFVPSGRVHAIGAGCTIFEIQQNSDTTYRVFDWNRIGPDGKPRQLHVADSLESIDFTDFEPSLIASEYREGPSGAVRPLVNDPLFQVDARRLEAGHRSELCEPGPCILGMLRGELRVGHTSGSVTLTPGRFCLIPACLSGVALQAMTSAEWLAIWPR